MTAMPSSRTSWPSCWRRKSRCPRPCDWHRSPCKTRCWRGSAARPPLPWRKVCRWIEALAEARFPDSLTALVAWGQQKNCLAEAFRAAAEAFEARTNSQSALLNMLVLPVIYLIIVTFVGFTIIALMMPLISVRVSVIDCKLWIG